MILTIAIVTWNRSGQLLDALQSCLDSDLPDDAQFVIVDNGSTDGTRMALESFFKKCSYNHKIHFSDINLGAGIGRNLAFSMSDGDYIYFMDDDAFIDSRHSKSFFKDALRILGDNPKVATLTTQIYDLAWERNRIERFGPSITEEIKECFMLCGGSHFLRRSFFLKQKRGPFMTNKYGYEELLPSLMAVDSGMYNAVAPSLIVMHNPKVNKWLFSDRNNEEVLITEIANQKGIKGALYPWLFYPLVCIAYELRCMKYLDRNQKKKSDIRVQSFKELEKEYPRIKARTLLGLLSKYGFSIF